MNFSIKYQPLFEVQILHRFFLNKGANDYFAMNQTEREKQLAGYSVANYLEIIPTAKSRTRMSGHRMVFTANDTGFIIWIRVEEADNAKPLVDLADNLELTFLVKLLNHSFFNYTDLPLSAAGKLFFFGNKRPSGENMSFPLIQLSGTHSAINESFVLSDKGHKTALLKLNPAETKDLLALVAISMKGESVPLNITISPNEIRANHPVFELLFDNRQTTWRYIFNKDQQVKNKDDVEKENGNARRLITKNIQPLTKRGFISVELGGKELPNPDEQFIKPDSANDKIYSEIYM